MQKALGIYAGHYKDTLYVEKDSISNVEGKKAYPYLKFGISRQTERLAFLTEGDSPDSQKVVQLPFF